MLRIRVHVSDEIIVGHPLKPENRWGDRDVGRTHLRLFTARAVSELAAYHGDAVERFRTWAMPLLPLIACWQRESIRCREPSSWAYLPDRA